MKRINMQLLKAAEFGPQHADVIEKVQNHFRRSVLEETGAPDEDFYLSAFLQEIRHASSITSYMKFVAERLHNDEEQMADTLSIERGEGANKRHRH
jgi:hypothetical protein